MQTRPARRCYVPMPLPARPAGGTQTRLLVGQPRGEENAKHEHRNGGPKAQLRAIRANRSGKSGTGINNIRFVAAPAPPAKRASQLAGLGSSGARRDFARPLWGSSSYKLTRRRSKAGRAAAESGGLGASSARLGSARLDLIAHVDLVRRFGHNRADAKLLTP